MSRGLEFWALSQQGWNLRGTYVSDGGGGGTSIYVSGGTVACRIDPIGSVGADERISGERLDDRSTHKVTVPSGTDVVSSDRWQIAGVGLYEVTAVRFRTDELNKVFEVVSAS